MLSRRDKLLLQPWEERRFKDHRLKVGTALPVIDNAQPLARPHVITKLKKNQKEKDRLDKIRNDNFSLLQRLGSIMKINRLDNHWERPQPKFHHKVGLYFDVDSLSSKIQSGKLIDAYNVSDTFTHQRVKCFACEINKQKNERYIKLDLQLHL